VFSTPVPTERILAMVESLAKKQIIRRRKNVA
jgi:hypothetical protein